MPPRSVKGGYVLHEEEGADVTLVSTGSEVCICVDAVKELKEKHNIKARVVSIPCFEVFDAQSKEYRLSVLPDGIPSLSVEVMSTMGWERYTHEQFGLNRFGASGAYKDVYKKFEFTPEGIAKRAVATVDFWKDVPNIRSPINPPVLLDGPLALDFPRDALQSDGRAAGLERLLGCAGHDEAYEHGRRVGGGGLEIVLRAATVVAAAVVGSAPELEPALERVAAARRSVGGARAEWANVEGDGSAAAATDGVDELENEERLRLEKKVRDLESENHDLRRGLWQDKRRQLSGGQDVASPGGGGFQDVDLGGASPLAGRRHGQHGGGGLGEFFQSGINALTGHGGDEDGFLEDDDMDFDEDAFRQAQADDAKARLERIKDIKRGLKNWEGWRLDLVEIRRGGEEGHGEVFEVYHQAPWTEGGPFDIHNTTNTSLFTTTTSIHTFSCPTHRSNHIHHICSMADDEKTKAEKLAAAKKRVEAMKKKKNKKAGSSKTKEEAEPVEEKPEEKADEAVEEKNEEAVEDTKPDTEEPSTEDRPASPSQAQPSLAQQSKLRSASFRKGSISTGVTGPLSPGPFSPDGESATDIYRKHVTRIEELEKENKRLAKDAAESEKRWKKAEEDLADLREEDGEASAKQPASDEQVDKLKSEIAALERQNSQLQQQVSRGTARHGSSPSFATGSPPAKFEFTPEGIAKRAVATVDFWKDVPNIRSPINRAFQQLI
ncbi:hypothetical protein BN1723_007703 [Verticillium longisporum]|uniref:transketolase n=1 Tax=Verticillium longisporum TaxID=100787 RepID=A0A0G4NMN9_VERLO|nr:hypothetical protein BN1723_007703 [Verticillium longisporum]